MIYSLAMTGSVRIRQRINDRLRSTTLFTRIALGNAIVIVFGAIAGTLLTRHLTDVAADIWLIIFFATLGIWLSVVVNFWIIRTALKPLHELRRIVEGIQVGSASVEQLNLTNPDPDIELLATALSSLITQLESSNQRLRALSERAIHVQEEERKRIARSLHDDTGQALSTLIFNLERLENRFHESESEMRDQVGNARKLAANMLNELRKVISGLRPSVLDDLGLIPAIRWYARTNLEGAGVNVTIDAREEGFELPGGLSTTLFRISQEAVANIIRHAQAKNVLISLKKNEKQVYLVIKDDGRGFDPSQALDEATRVQHWGLLGIQERADLIGGEFRISSAPAGGSLLEVIFPIEPSNEITHE
jgi:two-component system, NarL family, sensor histidine kinase UhpB